ncbi:MAG: LTA synthase family protein [Ruminococcus sp.]|nr:LTA synthase family protein [Ruminococcus sp.]
MKNPSVSYKFTLSTKFALSAAAVMLLLMFPVKYLQFSGTLSGAVVYFIVLIGLFAGMKVSGLDIRIKEKFSLLPAVLAFISVPFIETLYTARPTALFIREHFFGNLSVISVLYLVLFLIFRHSAAAAGISAIFSSILYILNEFLVTVRGLGFTPADVYAFKTALTVAGKYSLEPRSDFYASVLSAVFIIIMTLVFPFNIKDLKNKKFKIYTVGTASAISLAFGVSLVLKTAFDPGFISWRDQDKVFQRGVYYNIFSYFSESRMKPPENYSKEYAEEILSKYTAVKGERDPNVIVVINESFSDLNQIADMEISEDNMSFLHSLSENTARGKAVVSCFGGHTCNSEFEFMTGLSMKYLPSDCFVFLQYIRRNTRTFINSLEGEKIYIHPFIGSNYRRSVIYGYLGFDKFFDGAAFTEESVQTSGFVLREAPVEYKGAKMIRGYISDEEAYNKVISDYEQKPAGTPMIQVLTTIQNHSGYTYSGSDFTADVTSGKPNTPQTDQYLSLVKLSDSAFKMLVEYFSDVDEDVVIIFFGDHMPPLNEEIEAAGLAKSFDTDIESVCALYSTPFFIWTNFPSESEDLGYVSLNYLASIAKERTGMNLSRFDGFLLDAYEKYPLLSLEITQNADGETVGYTAAARDESLDEYEVLQYYFLFDGGAE